MRKSKHKRKIKKDPMDQTNFNLPLQTQTIMPPPSAEKTSPFLKLSFFIPIFVLYLILIAVLGWKLSPIGYTKGFDQGKLDDWNQRAIKETLSVGKLLSHYTYEYRLSGSLVEIGDGYIVVSKGKTTKKFDTAGAGFILGDKNLSLEDNMFGNRTSCTQLSDVKDRLENFKVGDNIILVTRARHMGEPLALTQVIKMKGL